MKRFLALLLCLTMVLTMAGCGGSDAYVPTGDALTPDADYTGTTAPATDQDQELTLTYYPGISMNPYVCTDFTNRALFSLLYQSLFIVDRSYGVEPALCKSYRVSEDMKTYTFYMEAATFSDGSVLTAEDVLASLQAAKAGPVYSGRFTHVAAMELSGDGGVTVTMDTACESLPLLLDIPILRKDQVELDRPLGTGPYVLENAGQIAQLCRRTDWWCSAKMLITASSIRLVAAENETQIRDEFEFADLSLVCADPGSDRYADYRCDYELWDCENNIFLYLGCNMASPVFSDPEVRAALTGAIDRDALVEDDYRGFARSATLPASPLSPYYNSTLAARYGYDAGAAFTEAVKGVSVDPEYTVTLLVNAGDSLRVRVAKKIVEDLNRYGLPIVLQAMDADAYLTALRYGNFDLYLGQTKLSANMDLSAFFSEYGALSYGHMSDVGLYALCNEALANHGNLYTLHQNVMDDGRLCPILFRSYAVYATRGLLTDLTPARDNIFYYSLGKTMEKAKLTS